MIYRRFLPVAAGAALIAGGWFTLGKSDTSKRYNGARIHDHGLRNYTYVDARKFDLINVAVLTRHGARTPNYYVDSQFDMPDWQSEFGYVNLLPDLCYATDVKELPSKNLISEETIQDEYVEHNKGKCNYGQLTLIGQEQSLAFGKELRKIYITGNKFLNQEFDENEILCRSTKFPRTYYTLKGILSGLYGIDSFDMCHRPIIYTMPIGTDTMYPNTSVCPVITSFTAAGISEISKDPEIIKMKCLLKKILGVKSLKFSSPDNPKVKKKCDKNKKPEEVVDENVPIYAVRDDLYSRQVHDFEVPVSFPTLTPEINRLSSQEILYEYLGGPNEWEDRIAILVSPTINFIKDNMKKVADECLAKASDKSCVPDMKDAIIKKKSKMKMQLLSCHDTTLIPLLVCLRIYDGQWPLFMSNLIIELYKEKETNNLFTRVLYYGKVQKIKVSETNCDATDEYEKLGLLPFNDFTKLIEKYSFPDEIYTSACDKAMKLFTSGKPVTKSQYT